MKKYKVIALSVQGVGKNIWSCGQILEEDKFIDGHIPELISGGFIEEYEEKESKEPKKAKK